MNALTWVLAAAALVPTAVCAVYGVRHERAAQSVSRARAVTALLVAFIAAITVAGYGVFGRFSDWNHREVDEFTDWQLAAKITQARRAVKESAEDASAQLNLAQAYYDAGRYKDAVDTLDAATVLCGERLEFMSLKAEALYYRDARSFSKEVKDLVNRVLTSNPYNVPVRLLIANDAFLNGRYQEAIDQWELLLRSGAAAGQAKALNNAIANARSRMTRKD